MALQCYEFIIDMFHQVSSSRCRLPKTDCSGRQLSSTKPCSQIPSSKSYQHPAKSASKIFPAPRSWTLPFPPCLGSSIHPAPTPDRSSQQPEPTRRATGNGGNGVASVRVVEAALFPLATALELVQLFEGPGAEMLLVDQHAGNSDIK